MSISNLLTPSSSKGWADLWVDTIVTGSNSSKSAIATYVANGNIALPPNGNLRLGAGGAGPFVEYVRAGPVVNLSYDDDGFYTTQIPGLYKVTAHVNLTPNTPPEGQGVINIRIVSKTLLTTYAACIVRNNAISASGGETYEVTFIIPLNALEGFCVYVTSSLGNACTINGGSGTDEGYKTYIIAEKVGELQN